jgi:hypothetical protein
MKVENAVVLRNCLFGKSLTGWEKTKTFNNALFPSPIDVSPATHEWLEHDS